ncbi:MAG: HAMP domain-containing histidine kinase [Sandaracinaceae bacterium]|nr:HAMP domain-containing histidine kinase [Sandaracinaceae bacterium]
MQQAIATLDALRAHYSEAIRSAHARTALIQGRARLAGAAAASLLLAGLLAVAVAVRRYVVSPLVELQGALRRHRAGEIDARATPRGGAEMREVMEELEDLTAALRSQRAAQLTYLAGVAHDLRNPLAALRAAALVARAERDGATRARAVELIDRQIGRIERMVGDLLDATRIEAGEVALELAPVDLRAVCAEVVRLYSSSTRAHTLELSAPSDPVVVQADALRLEQVVGNLVSNAIKYSPRGGPVRVAVSRRGDRAVIEVADRGIGMSAEQAASAFLPFRRSAAGVAPGSASGSRWCGGSWRRTAGAWRSRARSASAPRFAWPCRSRRRSRTQPAPARSSRSGGGLRAGGHGSLLARGRAQLLDAPGQPATEERERDERRPAQHELDAHEHPEDPQTRDGPLGPDDRSEHDREDPVQDEPAAVRVARAPGRWRCGTPRSRRAAPRSGA